jgi:SAM-dependent methyltransferase
MPAARSFRDPSGSLVEAEGRIVRTVRQQAAADLAFLDSAIARQLTDAGSLVRTTTTGTDARGDVVLEHERIPFVSFPYEWPPEMLHAAAELTLDFAIRCAPDGFGLKDATPYNVLFRGPNPVFIDVLSFERRNPGDATWLAYAQFVRTFLLPLLAWKHLGLRPDQLLLADRDGIEPETFYRWLRPFQRLGPSFFSLVTMPTWLASRSQKKESALYRERETTDYDKAAFILNSLLSRVQRQLKNARPRQSQSAWSSYMTGNNNYTEAGFAAKEEFVAEVLREREPASVLDVGCNTGHFSLMAARGGARTVAIDLDPVVAGRLWLRARSEKLDILPLVVNLARPTPAVGWRNRECPSFLERSAGQFDAVLMLAVLHHLLVTERIPLDQVIDQAAELTRDLAIIEFISPADSMFRRIARGRDHLHTDLTAERFEYSCGLRFELMRKITLDGGTRCVYALRKKSS